jgi:hypothetical protein
MGMAVIWWSLPTPCLNSLRVFTKIKYDYLIVVHKVATPCICLLNASQPSLRIASKNVIETLDAYFVHGLL